MYKGVFLDRDGTINEDVGDFCSLEKLVFIPRAIEGLKILQEKFLLFIVTNQSAIGKNLFSEKEFLEFNDSFRHILKNEGIVIKHIYYCPHTKEENCICRKPSPHFLKKAEKEFSINLKSSYAIGDHPHDVEMANKAGTGSVYLLTGHGEKHKNDLLIKPDFIANDLYEASIWIKERSAESNRSF